MEVAAASFPDLNPAMELEQVFWYFFVKFQHLRPPKSVSEGKISSDEMEFLGNWFASQFGKPKNWCDRTWQEPVEQSVTASSREMFGALFLILASEVCRDRCNEDSVWPTVATAFLANKTTHSVLFANQHPTEICKIAMAAGVHKLGLRNLIERYGKQEYFDTLKLQIGFTFQGAARRLPEWLDGFGHTTAVKLLNGFESDSALFGLRSRTFQDLWHTLRDFRANRTSEPTASAFLRASPWVRPSWIPRLLEAATVRRVARTFPAPELPGEALVAPLCEPVLRWQPPAKPALQFRLNEERVCELLAGKETAIFAIDGVVVGHWAAELGGGFRGERQLECQKPGTLHNLRPQRLTVSSNGESIEEVSFSDLGLMEPVLLFDLATGCKKDLTAALDPNCDYAVLCDTDIMVPDVPPSRTKNRNAFLLGRPLAADTRLMCDGALYWQPQLVDRKPRRVIRVSIESASQSLIAIGSEAQLVIRDAPDDAEEVTLLIGDSKRHMVLTEIGWTTTSPLLITLGTAMGAERLRARIKGQDYLQTVVPKLSVRLSGVGVRLSKWDGAGDPQWHLLNSKESLNRAGGDGRVRIFGVSEAALYEGPRQIELERSATVDLRDLHGWGNGLLESSEADQEKTLIEAVEDRGCVDMFVPTLFGRAYNRIYLRTPRPSTSGHVVWAWSDIHAQPIAFSERDIRVEQDGFVWEISRIPPWPLMAVTYEGTCLGAYWNLDLIAPTLTRPLSAKAVALIRWLKLPVLSARIREPLQRVVLRSPGEFLRGWLDAACLARPFHHRVAEQGLDTVVRALFWNFSEVHSGRVREIVQALSTRLPQDMSSDTVENFKKALLFLGEVCPSFAYNLARADAGSEKYQASVRSAIQELLSHSSNSSDGLRTSLQLASGNCARLCNITSDELNNAVKLYALYLAGDADHYPQERALRRLGEVARGREYLIAALLIEWSERNAGWRN